MAEGRDALFELAVNRAASVADRLATGADPAARRHALEIWYLKTRFAQRLRFDALLAALARRPEGDCHWHGGEGGRWLPGPPSSS